MVRYAITVNKVLDRLWNKSGDEEDISGDEFEESDENDEDLWTSLKAQITILRVLQRRNHMIMILMEESQITEWLDLFQSVREIDEQLFLFLFSFEIGKLWLGMPLL